MLGQVERERALSDLRRLTGEETLCVGSSCRLVVDRLTGGADLWWATEYISSTLASSGYSVSSQNWSSSGHSDRNIIAEKRGNRAPGEKIYVIAHADGVRRTTGERYPAADDDASGVTAILEAARVLSTGEYSRTLVLLFTTGEEQGALGARSHLNGLSPQELRSIKYAIDVDMVGYDGNGDTVMELWHGGDPPSMALAQVMADTIRAYEIGLTPHLVVGCG